MDVREVSYGANGDMSCAIVPEQTEEQAVQLLARSNAVGSDVNARNIFDVLRLGGFKIVRAQP